jgi:hypothetical protein
MAVPYVIFDVLPSMERNRHVCCVIAILGVFLCSFALSAENNDSRVLFVPKSEFVEVISGIIGTSDSSRQEEFGSHRADGSKLSSPQESGEEANTYVSARLGKVKRDSFFYLQKSLENRRSSFAYGEDSLSLRSRPSVLFSPTSIFQSLRYRHPPGELIDGEYGA